VALNVQGKAVRRLVTSRAILLERLHHDPVEVALELVDKLLDV
jgi:hypothetical protein